MTDRWDDADGPIPLPVVLVEMCGELPDEVMGLADVARGMGTAYPQTIYLVRGDDRSGAVGVLYPDGTFLTKWASTTGHRFEVEDEFLVTYQCEVRWDGAQPCPLSPEPVGFQDEAQFIPVFHEHSKGLLLGDYAQTGELWRSVNRGTKMQRNGLPFNLGVLDFQQLAQQQAREAA